MGNPKAFLTIPRKEAGYRPIHDRILDFSEVEQTLNSNDPPPTAGFALHGLRCALLSLGLSVGQQGS